MDLGLVGTAAGLGFVVGALVTGRLTTRLGVGMTLAVSIASGFVGLANPLAQYGYPVLVLGVVSFIIGLLVPAYNINQVSLRQAITPNRLQGRMNATMRTIVLGTIPVGSIVGGILGGYLGIVDTIVVGALISGFASLWILLGPVARIRTQPEVVSD